MTHVQKYFIWNESAATNDDDSEVDICFDCAASSFGIEGKTMRMHRDFLFRTNVYSDFTLWSGILETVISENPLDHVVLSPSTIRLCFGCSKTTDAQCLAKCLCFTPVGIDRFHTFMERVVKIINIPRSHPLLDFTGHRQTENVEGAIKIVVAGVLAGYKYKGTPVRPPSGGGTSTGISRDFAALFRLLAHDPYLSLNFDHVMRAIRIGENATTLRAVYMYTCHSSSVANRILHPRTVSPAPTALAI
jgi:hypothetical protein